MRRNNIKSVNEHKFISDIGVQYVRLLFFFFAGNAYGVQIHLISTDSENFATSDKRLQDRY